MPNPLRPRPPTTVLVPDPYMRRDLQDNSTEAVVPAQDQVPAGFLKNAIDQAGTDGDSPAEQA